MKQTLIAMLVVASTAIACAAPAPIETGAIQTAAASTVIAQVTANAPNGTAAMQAETVFADTKWQTVSPIRRRLPTWR